MSDTTEALHAGAFQASAIGMAFADLDGTVVRANPALCQMLGFAEVELVGTDARRLVSPDHVGRMVKTLEGLCARSDPSVSMTDVRVQHREGHCLWAGVTASLIRVDGESRFLLIQVADRTEERRAEAILRAEQERLGEIVEAQRDLASSELEIDRLLGVLVKRAVRLAGAGAVAVLLPEKDQLVVHAAAGTPEIPLGYSLPIAGSLAGSALRSGHTQRTADARKDPRTHTATTSGSGLRSMISTPLLHGSQVKGVLQLMSEQPGGLDEIDVRTLEMVAGFAASAFDRASTSQRLQASERRTRAVIESAPYPIVIFDTGTGDMVEFNPAAEASFGRSRLDSIGKPATELLPSRHVEAFKRWLRHGQEAGTPIYAGTSFETTGRKADGTEFPIEVAVADLPEETHLAAAFIRDVSLRQRLRESSARLASVVAGTPVILLAFDMAGVVTLSEGKGLTAFGLTPGDTTGRNLHDLLADEPDAHGHLERALRGEAFSGLIHLAGPDTFFEASYGPIRDDEGTMTGVSAMLTDVSDRIHVDAARKESEAKSRLMAMMNHEVRTPLNSILGFATLLAESRVGALNDQQRRYVANIDAAGRQLLELVNEALDLARLKAGRTAADLRDLPAQNLMTSAVERVQPMADAVGVALVVEPAPDVFVRADHGQLVQVLLNLLSNAIRHTSRGGTVEVSSTVQADRVAIRVADSGQGIAREDLGHIFEEFYQARNHAPGGTGLGLTISRNLVEQMRGTISVESELGVGSKFTVSLERGAALDSGQS